MKSFFTPGKVCMLREFGAFGVDLVVLIVVLGVLLWFLFVFSLCVCWGGGGGVYFLRKLTCS